MRIDSAPGTVTQVRGSAQSLIRFAKHSGATIILVGHVTKDGQIAGPRVVEHMVDAVLSFEGEGSHQFRILRAVKNRFGPTDEIGVFEMTGLGLREVANPSELFLSERDLGSAGNGGICRHRGHATGPGRNPGAGRRHLARNAAARGGRLGPQPAVHGACRARGPLRRAPVRPRRLSQRRRRPAHPGAGGGLGGGCGLGLLARERAACGGCRVFSAKSRSRAPFGRSRRPRRGCAKRPSSASTAPSCRKRARTDTGDPGLTLETVASLATLVADIAARGSARTQKRQAG